MALRFFVIIRFAHDFRHRLSITKQVCFCIRLALKFLTPNFSLLIIAQIIHNIHLISIG